MASDGKRWRDARSPSLAEMEALASEAYAALPEQFRALCEGLVIRVEDFPDDDTMREMIRAGQPVNAIRTQARKGGMYYLQEVGLQKVQDGITSMNEVLRVMRDEEPPQAAARPGGRPAA